MRGFASPISEATPWKGGNTGGDAPMFTVRLFSPRGEDSGDSVDAEDVAGETDGDIESSGNRVN
jgi:hypothetical protein